MMRRYILLAIFLGVILSPISQAQEDMSIITPENIAQLTELQVIGRGVIYNAIYSPDGTLIAVAGSRGIWLYDAQNLDAEPRLLNGHDGPVTTIAFSPDGRLLASGSTDEFVIDPDIHLWDVATGEMVATLTGHTDGVGALAFHPSGEWLVSGAWQFDGTLRLWKIVDDNGELTSIIEKQFYAGVTDIDFNSDGSILAVSVSDNRRSDGAEVYTILFEDVLEGITNYTSVDGSTIQSLAVSYHPTLPRFAYTVFARMGIWDTENNKSLFNGQLISAQTIYDLEYDPTGTYLAIYSSTGEILFWDATTHEKLFIITSVSESLYSGRYFLTSNYARISFHPDGSQLLALTDHNTIQIWDINSRQQIHIIDDFSTYITDLAVADNHEFIGMAFARYGYYLQLFGTNLNSTIIRPARNMKISSAQLSPNGTTIIYIVRHVARDIRLVYRYDVLSNERQLLDVRDDDIRVSALSYLGLMAIENSQTRELEIWDLSELELLFSGEDMSVFREGFFIENSFYSYFLRYFFELNLINGEVKELLNTDNHIYSMAFSNDKLFVALGTGDLYSYILGEYPIELFVLETGERINRYYGNTSASYSVTFSPDNKLLASGALDGTVRIWDIQTGEQVALLNTHTDSITQVLFSEDGTRLATASEDGTIRLWGVMP